VSDDIVRRLFQYSCAAQQPVQKVMFEAMDTIDRLRAELAAEKERGEQLRKAMYDMHRASNAKGEDE
jgi:hypothetical protein